MCDGLPSVDVLLHHSVLINTDCCQHIQRVLVARIDTIENETDHNLLPRRSTLVPELGLLQVDDIADILHDTVQGTRRQDLVFVIVCDGDQQFGVSIVDRGPQVITVPQRELVRITRGRRVYR